MENFKNEQDAALWSAAYEGDAKGITKALKAGADVNATNYLEMTPLMAALDSLTMHPRTRLKIVKILVEAGANVHNISQLGENALTLAIDRGDLKVLEFLAEQGADLHARTLTGDNLIYRVVDKAGGEKKYVKILSFLLEKGVDPDVRRTDNGQTALFRAVDLQETSLVNKLLKAGAEVNIKDTWGLTPLHYAARRESYSIPEALIKAGADVDAQDDYGFTPLHEAVENGHGHIVNLLLNRAGANPTLALFKDFEHYPAGTTPADIAKQKGLSSLEMELRIAMEEREEEDE